MNHQLQVLEFRQFSKTAFLKYSSLLWESITGNPELRFDYLICSYKAKKLHGVLHKDLTSLFLNSCFKTFLSSEVENSELNYMCVTVSFVVSMTVTLGPNKLLRFAVYFKVAYMLLL